MSNWIVIKSTDIHEVLKKGLYEGALPEAEIDYLAEKLEKYGNPSTSPFLILGNDDEHYLSQCPPFETKLSLDIELRDAIIKALGQGLIGALEDVLYEVVQKDIIAMLPELIGKRLPEVRNRIAWMRARRRR